MQCWQCGAATRPGMAQCPNCGAQITEQDAPSFDSYRPPQQGYIPGGGLAAQGAAAAPEPSSPGGAVAQPRTPGSLGRRLRQAADARDPNAVYPPPPPRGSNPQSRSEGREPQRGHGPPDEREGRSRPASSSRRRIRDYDDDGPPEPDSGRAAGRRPTPSRRDADWGRDESADGESEEMIARRGPRAGSSRRSGPPQPIPPWDDSSNQGGDSRSSPDGRGPGRRSGSSAPSSGSRGRGPSRYDDEPRRGGERFEPPGYTDERPASRYDDFGAEGYSEELDARPRYPDDRRGPASGAHGPRSAPEGRRTPARRPDGERGSYGYDEPDDFGRDGYGRSAASRSGGRSRGGAAYPPQPFDEPGGYTDYSAAYPVPPWQAPPTRGPHDSYEESSVWASGGQREDPWGGRSAGGARGGSKKKAPAKNSGAFAMAFRLLTLVIVAVGLVTVVGPELAPKLDKYLPFLRSNAAPTQTAPFATYTPGPTPTSLPNYKLFVSKANAYAMDYPTAWGTATVTGSGGAQSDSVDQFTQAGGPAGVNIERAQSFASATDAQVIQAEVQSAQARGTQFTEITSAATTEGIGGEVWQRREYKAVAKNGAKLHLAVLACHHLGNGYVIVLISSDTGFASDDSTTFEPMLRSFRFM